MACTFATRRAASFADRVHRWPLKTESFGLRSDVKLWSPMVIETGATACIGGTSKDINARNVSNIGDEWSG